MVTAELAVATLAVLAVLLLMCAGLHLLVMQMRIIDTAGEVARQAARDDDAAVARAQREAPPESRVRVRVVGGVARVVVRLDVRPLASGLGPVPLRASAEVVTEPGVGARR